MIRTFLNFWLLGLAACQRACTFAEYGAEQNGECFAAPSSGTCPSLTSGTPTLYGSVENWDNSIAFVFKDYLNLHYYRSGIPPHQFDLSSAFNIVGVVNDDIEYCTNKEVLGSEPGHCDTVSGIKASDLFYVDRGTVRLKLEVKMKTIGGPRHMIKLITNKADNCFVYYKTFIFPSSKLAAEAELADSNKILEHIGLPMESLTNNGLNPIFDVKIYDNVFCAIRDECRFAYGYCHGDFGGSNPQVKPLDFLTVSTSFSGDLINAKIVSGPIIGYSENPNDEMTRFWYSKNKFDEWEKFSPGQPFCKISVQFEWYNFEAKSLADNTSLTEKILIENMSVHGLFENSLLVEAEEVFDMFEPILYQKYALEISTITEEVAIADVDDLPAIFVSDKNCRSYSDCRANIGDKLSIGVSYEDCKYNNVLLTVGIDIFVIDGDRGIDNPNVGYKLLENSKFGSFSGVRCFSALPPGDHSFTLRADQNDREDRSSYLSVEVIIAQPTLDWDSIINLPDATKTYEYYDSLSYVRNSEDASKFLISVSPPFGQEVIVLLTTPGFALIENNELLKTAENISLQKVSLFARLYLLENGSIIASDNSYDLGQFNIQGQIVSTSELSQTVTSCKF